MERQAGFAAPGEYDIVVRYANAVPADHAGTEVIAYLFSTPVALGAHTVSEDGGFSVSLPAHALGEHKVAVYADEGALIGWDDLNIKAKK